MQRIFTLLFLVLILSACGQKGDLFLKDADQQSSKPEKTAQAVSPEDNNKSEPDEQ